MNRYGIFFATALFLLFFLSSAAATVWYVHPDSALNSIQAALNSCSAGDSVCVGPGIYYEHIAWPFTQGIDLYSEYGADTTIIDGTNNGIVIAIEIGVDTSTHIIGFTIRNGSNSTYAGGGILCESYSSPIISNNFITANAAIHGGGIYCTMSSSPIISGNTISSNSATYYGGGIFATFYCAPVISGNTVTQNTAGWAGAGFCSGYSCASLITYNTISQNTSDSSGAGIGVGLYCTPTIRGNTISSNTTLYGKNGGIGCSNYSVLTIDSCTISNNNGSGIGTGSGCSLSVNYCNITGNAGYGLQNWDSTIIVNAEYNWWGDASGPGGFGPGTGDSVSQWVDYDPWLGGPVGIETPDHRNEKTIPRIKLHVFPNPFATATTASLSGIGQETKRMQLHIYDTSGRMVKSIRLETNTYELGVDLVPGIYFLKLRVGEHSETKKIIKIR